MRNICLLLLLAGFFSGCLSLEMAAYKGDIPKLERLLADGAAPDKRNKYNKQTALHVAALYSQLEAARLLIEKGADVNATHAANSKCTALHIAVENGDAAMARLLLEKGANPDPAAARDCGLANRRVTLSVHEAYTPLELAQKRGNETLIALLRSAIARRYGAVASGAKNADEYGPLVTSLLNSYSGGGKTIAVAGFSYADGRKSADGNVVAERLTTELVNRKRMTVVERRAIEKVLQELNLQNAGAISPESAKRVGQLLGADLLVIGSLVELSGKVLELNVRLVGVESGEALSAVTARVPKDWVSGT